MERLPVRALDVSGNPAPGRYLDSAGAWTEPLPVPGDPAQVLTSVSGGDSAWFGNVVVLIENGGSVPAGTPAGAIIVEKAAP